MKRFAWFAFVLVIATYILQPIQDPDMGWHITVGRWIIANLKVPTEELWNRFALGKEWVAYSWSNIKKERKERKRENKALLVHTKALLCVNV